MTGDQGVIVPAANVGDLMLREDVVAACGRGEFAVYPVDSILEAIALFFERGARGRSGPPHPAGSVLARATDAARDLYHLSHPAAYIQRGRAART